MCSGRSSTTYPLCSREPEYYYTPPVTQPKPEPPKPDGWLQFWCEAKAEPDVALFIEVARGCRSTCATPCPAQKLPLQSMTVDEYAQALYIAAQIFPDASPIPKVVSYGLGDAGNFPWEEMYLRNFSKGCAGNPRRPVTTTNLCMNKPLGELLSRMELLAHLGISISAVVGSVQEAELASACYHYSQRSRLFTKAVITAHTGFRFARVIVKQSSPHAQLIKLLKGVPTEWLSYDPSWDPDFCSIDDWLTHLRNNNATGSVVKEGSDTKKRIAVPGFKPVLESVKSVPNTGWELCLRRCFHSEERLTITVTVSDLAGKVDLDLGKKLRQFKAVQPTCTKTCTKTKWRVETH